MFRMKNVHRPTAEELAELSDEDLIEDEPKEDAKKEEPSLRKDPKARKIVIPGTPLGPESRTCIAGSGTFVNKGIITSALLGTVTAVYTGRRDEDSGVKIVEICVKTRGRPVVVPSTADIVTATGVAQETVGAGSREELEKDYSMLEHGYLGLDRAPELHTACELVTQIGQRFAKCSIMAVGKVPLRESFNGTLRKEDIRAVKKDSVVLPSSVRCGDIVLARVIAMGDSSNYILSTAEEELGVVLAYGPAGVPMVPLTWVEMQCPVTGSREPRKVAKVVPPDFVKKPASASDT